MSHPGADLAGRAGQGGVEKHGQRVPPDTMGPMSFNPETYSTPVRLRMGTWCVPVDGLHA
ncbi:hypothetical protein GCM10010980_04740 [Corynebacterium marinum]|nr:hypothetical protein GCM10010980_04740 [Corynebacterium marinum]